MVARRVALVASSSAILRVESEVGAVGLVLEFEDELELELELEVELELGPELELEPELKLELELAEVAKLGPGRLELGEDEGGFLK